MKGVVCHSQGCTLPCRPVSAVLRTLHLYAVNLLGLREGHITPCSRIAAILRAVPKPAVKVALLRQQATLPDNPALYEFALTRASSTQHRVHVVQDQSEPPHVQAVSLDPGSKTLAGQAAARIVRDMQGHADSLREHQHRAQLENTADLLIRGAVCDVQRR